MGNSKSRYRNPAQGTDSKPRKTRSNKLGMDANKSQSLNASAGTESERRSAPSDVPSGSPTQIIDSAPQSSRIPDQLPEHITRLITTGNIQAGPGGPGGPGAPGGRGGDVTLHVGGINTVLDLLRPHYVGDALYDSGKRKEELAVTCQPETRTRILRDIRQWANGAGYPVCWLSGPAGTGKTTIAHTIAEEYDAEGRLAATFFFWRRTDRDDIKKLVPTLAFQIAQRIPLAQKGIEMALNNDWTIPDKALHAQLSKLVIEPVTNVKDIDQVLVIIDGLDECGSRDGISELIRLLGEMTKASGCSFRFLLTSRPEPDIKDAFMSHLADNIALWLALQDSAYDIHKYICEKLSQVRQKFRLEPSWPSASELESVVRQSEGLFIHAATALRYIDDRRGSPKDRLQKVLKIHTGVDPLYAQVIADAREYDNFDTVMRSLMYLRGSLTIGNLSQLLGLDVQMVLGGCHSVLVIPENDAENIRPRHASLRDFLTSQDRSRDLFCAPATCHATLMIHCLEAITNALKGGRDAPEYSSTTWYYHASSILSEANTSQGLGSLQSESETQVQQIDLKWLEFWMADALCWGGLPYLRGILLSSMKDTPEQHWSQQIKAKLGWIESILKTVS